MPGPTADARQVFAIDPGPTTSGVVLMSYASGGNGVAAIVDAKADNLQVVETLLTFRADIPVCIEWVTSYGMPVGASVFDMVYWIGRFAQAAEGKVVRVSRKAIKLWLCGNSNAKSSNVRRAVLDAFPPSGGGATPQVGTKSKPGPLYGVSSHAMSAVAVALTCRECPDDVFAIADGGRSKFSGPDTPAGWLTGVGHNFGR